MLFLKGTMRFLLHWTMAVTIAILVGYIGGGLVAAPIDFYESIEKKNWSKLEVKPSKAFQELRERERSQLARVAGVE